MGFHLLHRKFLHSQFAEIGYGIGSSLYCFLLFFYLIYKLGIRECAGRGFCKMIWACIASWFYAWEYCCTLLWVKLLRSKKSNQKPYIRELDEFSSSEDDGSSFSYNVSTGPISRRWRDYRGAHLRKSLRPRSHGIRVGISKKLSYGHRGTARMKHGNHLGPIHNIRVNRTSKFVRKGTSSKGHGHLRQRW